MRLLFPGCWETSVVLASASFWSTLLHRGKRSSHLWELGPAHRHVSERQLSEEFPFPWFLARAVRTRNVVHYFLLASYLAVPCLVFVCCLWSTENWTLWAQCLARLWIHVLHQYFALLDDLHTFSTVKWTRIQRCSVSVLTWNGEVCAADASALSPGMGVRTWKTGHTSTPCKLVSVTHCSVVVLCGHTHCTP